MNLNIGNRTRKKYLCNALVADGPLSRSRGLMFRKKPIPILFLFPHEGIWPIHSLFVFFRFDAVYLDARKHVSEIIPSIASWKFLIMPRENAQFLLELPAGQSGGISVGDELEWEGRGVE